MKHFFLTSLFIFLVFTAFSQSRRSFTADNVKFIEEMDEFMRERDNKKGKEIMEQFILVWNSGEFNEFEKDIIYHTTNTMLKRRMRSYPHFENYLLTLINMINTGQSDESFNAWQAALGKLISGETSRHFVNYLEVCNALFSENVLYESPTTKWVSSSKEYAFNYDSLPRIDFPSLNLRCFSKGDSSVIYNTKGVYYPTEKMWYGEGGKVTWERAALEADKVFAGLGEYDVKVTNPNFEADSVVFYNKNYFDQPLAGKLEEKILANVTADKASYPRFSSYYVRLEIKEIEKNIDYIGGFTMHGGQLIGSGNEERDALLFFKREGKNFLVAAAQTFNIRKTKITSAEASITMYHKEDSVYHPGLSFNFSSEDRKLVLLRNDQGIAQSPYFNTYHSVDMYFEMLEWKVDDPLIEFKAITGSSENTMTLESFSYFRESRFQQLQGVNDINPLTYIKQYSDNFGTSKIMVANLAEFMGYSFDQVKALMVDLANKGFLVYDFNTDQIMVQDRLFHYINAKNKKSKTDFDVLQINSRVGRNQSNAVLNLLNFDLRIEGVEKIFLSDSQNVFIYPDEKKIFLGKNRDFTFAGHVHAGRIDFYGNDFAFEYDLFKINLNNVDSLKMAVPSGRRNAVGEDLLVRVKSQLEHLTGDLLIDEPENKSGKQPSPTYPRFISHKDSYCYYEYPSVENGVYDKERFYFQLEPFEMDSLDNFSIPGVGFEGTMVTAGIFPDFEEKLTLRGDYSLGFERNTPTEGFPVYGGKGQYYSIVNLSHWGLRGAGTLNYITSETRSGNIIFYPDSMNTVSQEFVVKPQKEGVEFPPVVAKGAYHHWRPYHDEMSIAKRKTPLIFYNNQAELHGVATLKPEGLTGKGKMEFSNATMKADLMTYKYETFDSDTADFSLNSEQASAIAFATNNVKAHIDLKNRVGEFKSNGGGSYVDFPINQYICYMDQIKWFMDQEDLELSASEEASAHKDLDLEGAEFISVHPKQDSLRFVSPAAKYSLKTFLIEAEKVQYIRTADATVYPDSGYVVVEKKAKMRKLENSRIVANSVTKYHTIYNASVNIEGRMDYTAEGDYDYVDQQKQVQTIHFYDIRVDTTSQTYAFGEIDTAKAFYLSPEFAYSGKVKLFANHQFLDYEGYTRIEHECASVDKPWIKFESQIDPNNIKVPVFEDTESSLQDELSTGLVYREDSSSVYPTFLSNKFSKKDVNLLSPTGYLVYDGKSREYKITTEEKLLTPALPGNYVSLNRDGCILYNEGMFDFGMDFGQIKVNTAGTGSHFTVEDSTEFELIFAMDFFFDESAIKTMAEDFSKAATLDPVDPSKLKAYEKALGEFVGKEKAGKMISDYNLYGSFKKFPNELNKTMVFANVKMKWNPATYSYVSHGPLALGNIGKEQINKYVKGKIEMIKKRSGDVISIYFEADDDVWYYFNYQKSVMHGVSSNDGFNTVLTELKTDKRKLKTEKGETPYMFMVGSDLKKKSFLAKFVSLD